MSSLDADEIAFLRFIKAKKKGVPTDELRSEFPGDYIRWGNSNNYINQNPVTKNYVINYKGTEALQFEDKYGAGGTVEKEHPFWR